MAEQWRMDARIKAQIERIVTEIIEIHGATQDELKAFFASDEIRTRMRAGFDRMRDRKKTPVLQSVEDAQTD